MGYLEHIRKLAIATLRLDLNHALGAMQPPDGGGVGTIDQFDAHDVFRVDVEEFTKYLLIDVREVEFFCVGFPVAHATL